MYSEITQTEPRKIHHKANQKELVPSKLVHIWRGLDRRTYKYILTNRYYDTKILERNDLGFMIDLKKQRAPDVLVNKES